jgi:hypothetical protein
VLRSDLKKTRPLVVVGEAVLREDRAKVAAHSDDSDDFEPFDLAGAFVGEEADWDSWRWLDTEEDCGRDDREPH